MPFCPLCSQCPQCCRRTGCWGKSSTVLAYLARNGCKSSGGFCSEGRLLPSFQTETTFDKVPLGSKWLRQSRQKSVPNRGLEKPHRKVGSQKSGCQVAPCLVQANILSPQAKRDLETNFRSKPTKSVFAEQYLQDGNSGNNPVILAEKGMGYLAGLQRGIFPHSNKPTVKKVPQSFTEQSDLSVHSSSVWTCHCSSGVYQGDKGSETHGSSKGYSDPPVPRRLVVESPFPGNVPTAYPDPVGPLPKVGLGSKYEEIRTGSPAGLQLHRLPVRPDKGSRVAHSGPVVGPPGKIKVHHVQGQLHGQTIYVPDRTSYCHGEASLAGPSSYEAHPVAFETPLACARSPREGHSGSPFTPPSLVRRSAFTPSSTRSSAVYRRLKRRLGRTFGGLHCKRCLVNARKSPSHKFFRVKSSSPGLEELRASVQGSDCPCRDRQHHSGLLHKQARGYAVRLSLCPPLEASLLVPPQGNCSEGKAHSGSLECDSGQAFRAQPGDSNGVVPFSAGIQSVVLQVAPTTDRLVCDPVQSQTSSVCITGSGSDSLGGGRPESPVAGFRRVCLPTGVSDHSGGVKDGRSRMSFNNPDCPRLAKHVLVLGPRDSVGSDSAQSAPSGGSGDTAVQRASSQESRQSQSACMAPRITAIQKRGFSEEVAGRIEAPQRVSTRAVYKSKWAIFVKWCKAHKVDFRSPSATQIASGGYFGLAFATPPPRVERFSALTL